MDKESIKEIVRELRKEEREDRKKAFYIILDY